MGIGNIVTRDNLAKQGVGDIEEFFDDVVEIGFRDACRKRGWMQGSVLNWIGEDSGRMERYRFSKVVKAEMMANELVGLSDEAEDKEDVPVLKLRLDTRARVMGYWDRGQYGDRSQVEVRDVGGSAEESMMALSALLVENPGVLLEIVSGNPELKEALEGIVGGRVIGGGENPIELQNKENENVRQE